MWEASKPVQGAFGLAQGLAQEPEAVEQDQGFVKVECQGLAESPGTKATTDSKPNWLQLPPLLLRRCFCSCLHRQPEG